MLPTIKKLFDTKESDEKLLKLLRVQLIESDYQGRKFGKLLMTTNQDKYTINSSNSIISNEFEIVPPAPTIKELLAKEKEKYNKHVLVKESNQITTDNKMWALMNLWNSYKRDTFFETKIVDGIAEFDYPGIEEGFSISVGSDPLNSGVLTDIYYTIEPASILKAWRIIIPFTITHKETKQDTTGALIIKGFKEVLGNKNVVITNKKEGEL